MDGADSSHYRLALGDDYDAPELSTATSPGQVFAGHSYPAINISGQAQVQLGDRHYHSGTHDESQRFASSLHFPEIHRRYESVEDAHSDTFDWIFEPPGRQQPPWNSFVDWLENEQPLYGVRQTRIRQIHTPEACGRDYPATASEGFSACTNCVVFLVLGGRY